MFKTYRLGPLIQWPPSEQAHSQFLSSHNVRSQIKGEASKISELNQLAVKKT